MYTSTNSSKTTNPTASNDIPANMHPHHHHHNSHLTPARSAAAVAAVTPTLENKNKEVTSCSTCLYTGVGTCAAVSLYSLKTALLDIPAEAEVAAAGKVMTEKAKRALQSQKRFMLVFAGAWGLAGAYRWKLG